MIKVFDMRREREALAFFMLSSLLVFTVGKECVCRAVAPSWKFSILKIGYLSYLLDADAQGGG